MNWPWRKREAGNRHQWVEVQTVLISETIPAKLAAEKIIWRCLQCRESHPRYYGLSTVVPPEFGCTALPIPAEPRRDTEGLLVVRE